MKKNKASSKKSSNKLKGHGPSAGASFVRSLRSTLNAKIIEAVDKHELTHAAVAETAGTSRTRMTAILNKHVDNVSTDLLLRIVASLGLKPEVQFNRKS